MILDLLADKRLLWNTEVQDLVAIHFDLTAEECQWIRPHDRTRNRTYLSNETAWALVGLQSRGNISKPNSLLIRSMEGS